MGARTTRRLVGGTAIALALGAGVLGLPAGGGVTATATGGDALADRAAAMQRFAVFRRGGREMDPGVAASARRAGVDPSEARAVAMPLGAPAVTVLPRQEALCVYAGADGGPTSAYGCATWDDALAGRTFLTLSGGPGQKPGEAVVVGIVPDGAGDVVLHGRDGAQTLAVSDGVYAAKVTRPERLAIGATATIDLGHLPGVRE